MSTISKICGVTITDVTKIATVLRTNISNIFGIDLPSTGLFSELTTPDGFTLTTPDGTIITTMDVIVAVNDSSVSCSSEEPDVFGVSTIIQTPLEEDVKTPLEDYVAIVE